MKKWISLCLFAFWTCHLVGQEKTKPIVLRLEGGIYKHASGVSGNYRRGYLISTANSINKYASITGLKKLNLDWGLGIVIGIREDREVAKKQYLSEFPIVISGDTIEYYQMNGDIDFSYLEHSLGVITEKYFEISDVCSIVLRGTFQGIRHSKQEFSAIKEVSYVGRFEYLSAGTIFVEEGGGKFGNPFWLQQMPEGIEIIEYPSQSTDLDWELNVGLQVVFSWKVAKNMDVNFSLARLDAAIKKDEEIAFYYGDVPHYTINEVWQRQAKFNYRYWQIGAQYRFNSKKNKKNSSILIKDW